MVDRRGWAFAVMSGVTAILMTCRGAWAEPTFAERLGWPAGSKVVVFHVDDVGMTHDSNMGAIEALEKGVATSTSIMMPCPWVSEFAHYLKDHAEVDAGIHLTMTSLRGGYRWPPVAGKSAVPGLTDTEGCLWDRVPSVTSHANPDEIEAEIRAQVDRCVTLGLQPTHLDSHTATLFARTDYMERYVKVGIEMKIPILFAAGHMEYIRQENPMLILIAKKLGETAWEAGLPVIDDVHTASYNWNTLEEKRTKTIEFLRTMKPGITEFIVHCTRPTEVFQYISDSGPKRLADLQLMTDPEIKKVILEQGITLTTWRELKQRRDQVK